MRVIAGTARSMPLKTADGLDTRPTTDRIKETLFNMLQNDISGCRFLDLYAGSGGIGIEALSRQAKEAVFVENSKAACACIRENLEFTHLEKRAVVMEQDVLTAINKLKGKGPFDIIYIDPPYAQDLEKAVLMHLAGTDLVDAYTIVIIEEKLEVQLPYIEECGFSTYKVKNYKTNKHLFLKKNNESIGD